MAFQDFINKLTAEFEDIEVITIMPKTTFKEIIQMNSLNTVMLLGFMKTEYNLDLTLQDIFKDISLGDFYEKHIKFNELNGKQNNL